MPRKAILVVLPIAAWPARANGVSIRYYPLLEHLTRKADVDFLITADPSARASSDELVSAARSVHVVPQDSTPPTMRKRLAMMARVMSPVGISFEYSTYSCERIAAAIRKRVTESQYDAMHFVGWQNREALARSFAPTRGARITFDCVDSPYLHYQRSPHPNFLSRGFPPFRAYDLWKTRRWERSLLRNVDASIYISAVDANAAGRNAVSLVIPNGIYAGRERGDTAQRLERAPCIGFLGNMSYAPNVVGVLSLYHDVFVPLQRERPGLRLKIIGRDPVPEVTALASASVEVTGTVSEIWPHLDDVDAFVFPMTTGAGLQNKIIEVMYAGRPVVTTSICQQSVGATPGREIVVADAPGEMLDSTRALLTDPSRARALAEAGRQFVARHFDVDDIVRRFESAIVPDGDGPVDVAASTSR